MECPHAVRAIDRKHIGMKKPKKFGSEYRFLWVTDFNQIDLREKIEDGNLGFPPPKSLEKGEPYLHYFLLGDDTFALMPWIVKP